MLRKERNNKKLDYLHLDSLKTDAMRKMLKFKFKYYQGDLED